MNRRALLCVLAAGLLPGPLWAGFEDDVVRQLRGQGYAEIEVSRTFLGRVRIAAQNEKGLREIILNPRTGEILRDLFTPFAEGQAAALLGAGGSEGGGGGGDDGSDDDGHDDDSDDDRDDDHGDDGGDDDGGDDE